MTIHWTKSALRRDPAFAISEAERATEPDLNRPAALDLLKRSVEEMERIGKSLEHLSITQEWVFKDLSTQARRSFQSEFVDLRCRLAEDYFPVIDALHRLARTLSEAPNGSPEINAVLAPLAEGARMVEQKGAAYLEAMGVQAIPSTGELYDSRLHQAVEVREIPGNTEGCVVEEVLRGYRLGERVLRPAQVVVGMPKA